MNEKDREYYCAECGAQTGEPCVGAGELVHLPRRLKRLQTEKWKDLSPGDRALIQLAIDGRFAGWA